MKPVTALFHLEEDATFPPSPDICKVQPAIITTITAKFARDGHTEYNLTGFVLGLHMDCHDGAHPPL